MDINKLNDKVIGTREKEKKTFVHQKCKKSDSNLIEENTEIN